MDSRVSALSVAYKVPCVLNWVALEVKKEKGVNHSLEMKVFCAK